MTPKPKPPKQSLHSRRAAAFYRWLKAKDACTSGLRFARGKTAHEAWEKCEEQGYMSWFLLAANVTTECYCSGCFNGGPSSLRAKIKLPKRFEWEPVR